MLKRILVALLVLVAGVLVYATTKPDTFSVSRSATIQAPPERIYAALADFHRWPDWSPWEKLDPAMKRTYGGAATGRGATYAWEGDGKAGAGRMEIIDAQPNARLGIQLDFVKPIEGHNRAEFVLTPQGNATKVDWTMRGPAPYVSKLMQVFVNLDTMIGQDFEAGLANLKALAEKP